MIIFFWERPKTAAGLAQSVERLTEEREVAGFDSRDRTNTRSGSSKD